MYKKLFILVASTFISFCMFSQGAIAKLKYEEAEIAFEKKDYTTTLSKLDEAEKMLGKTNPKILYLKILAQDKIIAAEPLNDYSVLEQIRKNTSFYLKEYEKHQGYEDKFRDIYNINEGLKKYPATVVDFNKIKEKEERELEWKKFDQKFKEQQLNDAFKYFGINKCSFGLTIEENQKKHPDSKIKKKVFKSNGEDMVMSKALGIPDYFYVFDNIIIGFFGIIDEDNDDAEFSKANAALSDKIKEYSAKFGFEPTMENKNNLDYYRWRKNNKTISLRLSKISSKIYITGHNYSLWLDIKDDGLIKQ